MDINLIIVVGVLIGTIILLIVDKWRASYVFASASVILLVTRQIDTDIFLAGFANSSIISIFLLVILTSAINNHFNVSGLFDYLFQGSKSTRSFLARMGFSVAGLSSVMNNTPIVAMMIPYVYRWGTQHNVSPSKLLMPLSFATILGGMITMIGTSTNLVLLGLIQAEKGLISPTLLDFAIPGVLVTIAGVIYIIFYAGKLLPNNQDILNSAKENLKEYLIETKLLDDSPLSRKSVSSAGLRNLDSIFLVEIIRDNQVISPVGSEEIILGGDRLFFAGEPEKVVALVNSQIGLILPSQKNISERDTGMNLLETVIPANSILVGSTLKEITFRERFDAAVIAIHRNGEKLRGKIGELVLDKGDLLLISSGKSFEKKISSGKDLYAISAIKQVRELPVVKKRLFWLFSLLILGLSAFGVYSFFVGLVLMLGLSIVFRITNYEHMKQNISLDLLVILGTAVALSNALINSGGAEWLSSWLVPITEFSEPRVLILFIYLLTLVLTQFITNVASVSIVFPIAYTISLSAGINPLPIFMAMAFGASCSFLSPVGYQTNLMVFGPGNYKFSDFIRFGLPLTILYSAIVIVWILIYYA